MTKRAVIAMASTASAGVGLLAIAWLAARRLSASELGYFFAFLSFGALVQLADFGLSYAALQGASQLAGTGRLDELAAFAERVSRWNVLAAGIATGAVGSIGWVTFSSHSVTRASSVAWNGPWLGFLAGTFVVQLTTPGTFLREGSGKVAQMWRLRLIQELVGAAACLAALQLKCGIWSLAAFAFARAAVAAAWLAVGDPLRNQQAQTSYSFRRWMAEVWPFQWRIGLSGLSGYFIFRAFSPIILIEKGPVAAGQFGLAIAIMNLLIAVSTAWPASHKARYATLFASSRFQELRREFPGLLVASTALAIAVAIVLSVGLWQARARGVLFALRLPDPITTSIILGAAVVHHFVACYAMLLRAEGREPLLVPSTIGGLVTVSAIWLVAHFGSLRGVAITNLACALVGIPIVVLILRSRPHSISTPARFNVGEPS